MALRFSVNGLANVGRDPEARRPLGPLPATAASAAVRLSRSRRIECDLRGFAKAIGSFSFDASETEPAILCVWVFRIARGALRTPRYKYS